MADVIIDRIKKTVWVGTEQQNKTYNWISDNVSSSGKWYVINIEVLGNKGEIILPCDRTNMISIG